MYPEDMGYEDEMKPSPRPGHPAARDGVPVENIRKAIAYLRDKVRVSPEDMAEVLLLFRGEKSAVAMDAALARVREGVSRQRIADYEARAAFDRAHGLGKPARVLGN